MKIQDLTPPVAVPEPAWKQQLVEFWQQADDHHKIDLEVTLKMGDAAGARRIIESWQQEVIERQKKKSRPAKKKKSRVRYGYGGYWTPGFNFGGTELGGEGGGDGGGGGESVREASTPDGVSPSTKMFLEQDADSVADVIQDFVGYCANELGIKQAPRLQLRRDPAWSQRNRSFGRFNPATNRLDVSTADRHVMDVLRTVAHELVHYHQQEQQDLPPDAGETGSEYENEANARAGELMRDYGRSHPELFGSADLEEGWKQRLGGAALAAACAVGAPGCATTGQLAQGAQIAARTAQTMQGRNIKDIARAELEQEIKNYARAQRGDANAQNLSKIYQAQRRQQQNESSGYIPTKAEKNDPRFVMALSPDVQPGATGKNANKMALKTGPQGEPQLLIKGLKNALREFKETGALNVTTPTPAEIARKHSVDVSKIKQQLAQGIRVEQEHTTDTKLAREIALDHLNELPDYYTRLSQAEKINESEDLFEINMSSSNLRKLAAQTGAMAGMEFEMIVPDVGMDDVEPEYEPDYDQDQRSRSFSDIRDFFHDGDYNSRRDVDNLMEEIQGEYEEWKMDATADAWTRDGLEYITDYISLNDLFDRDEAMLTARDEIMDANPDLPPESEEFTRLLSARLDEMEREFAAQELEDQGRIYNDAFEAFAEEQADEYDERSFLDDKYPYMQDVQNNFDISWPYYIDINADNEGGADVDQVADNFSNYMGKPVNASRQYHGGRREAGTYVVEPDGSLEGDNPGDEGLEFVSPPMPIDEMISDLNKVKAWAKRENCYTNDSTGLHINISVPNYTLAKLDYVKLALLLGDEYVLELFGRSGNTYAKSAISKIKTMLQRNPDLAPQVMDKMREHMEDLATKAIHNGTTDKYTSINTKSGYIEFRSPGGDWLDENFDKIENTLLRFTVALSAAIDPEAYRQEYLKKLYKLLAGSQEKGGPDILQLFANYSAGELDKAALIRQVREKQLARDFNKGKIPKGQKYWWRVARPGYFASVEVVAASREEAIEKGKKEYPDWRNAQDMTAEPLRPYQEPQTPGAAGPSLNDRPSNPDGNWVIVDTQAPRTPVYRFMAANDRDALLVLRQWIAANPGSQWTFALDADQRLGQPGPRSAAQPSTGNWGIWMNDMDRFARAPGQSDNSVLRRFPSREAAEQFITQGREQNSRMRTDLEVREIEPSQPIPGSTLDLQRQRAAQAGSFREPNPSRGNLTPTGPGPWEIYRISDNSSVRELSNTSRPAAAEEARNALGLRGEAPELYGVRTRSGADAAQAAPLTNHNGPWEIFRMADGRVMGTIPAGVSHRQAEAEIYRQADAAGYDPEVMDVRPAQQSSDAAQGGTIDVATDRVAPRTLTTPGQPQQQFTGEWKIVTPDGNEIHRFGGIGNAQADANRVAIQWLQRNPRHMQAGVEVLPVMG